MTARAASHADHTWNSTLPAASDGPLAFASSKASVGHAEAGAGLVGLAAAVAVAECRALPHLLHLG